MTAFSSNQNEKFVRKIVAMMMPPHDTHSKKYKRLAETKLLIIETTPTNIIMNTLYGGKQQRQNVANINIDIDNINPNIDIVTVDTSPQKASPDMLKQFVTSMPKIELHVHLEGTLEPELVFMIAGRNGIDLSPHFKDVEDLRSRYEGFTSLDSFLQVYYRCASVLQTERDFYDATMAYLSRAKKDNVVYVELFFDPQCHKQRGVSFETMASGILAAVDDAYYQLHIKCKLIPCFLRHLSERSAVAMWSEIFKYLKKHTEAKHKIIGIGLDSNEKKNPPSKFHGVFWMIRHASKAVVGDMHIVTHAGEEGPSSYIIQALNLLCSERIDHGVQCVSNDKIVQRLRDERIPLTVCPLSNVKLRVFDTLKQHNLKRMIDLGLNVSIHSDDPAYFGGYITQNYLAVIDALGINERDVVRLALNAINSAFVLESEKVAMRQQLRDAARQYRLSLSTMSDDEE